VHCERDACPISKFIGVKRPCLLFPTSTMRLPRRSCTGIKWLEGQVKADNKMNAHEILYTHGGNATDVFVLKADAACVVIYCEKNKTQRAT